MKKGRHKIMKKVEKMWFSIWTTGQSLNVKNMKDS